MKLIEKAGALMGLPPSLFDVALLGLLVTPFMGNFFYKGIYFLFYSILLICFSLSKKKREYNSFPLFLLLVISLIEVFFHNNIIIVKGSVINYYLNVSIMFEGFLFILAGILLLKTIVEYSQNTRIIVIGIIIALIPALLREAVSRGRFTFLIALVISLFIYLIIKKGYFLAGMLFFIFTTGVIVKWSYVVAKLQDRWCIWTSLFKEILQNPIIGNGFRHTLESDNSIYSSHLKELVYRHNDYLSIISALGIVFGIVLIWFIIETVKRIGVSAYLIPLLTIVIAVSFQATLFFPERAAVLIPVIALCIKSSYKEEI